MLVAFFYSECVHSALSGSWIGWWVLVYSSGGIGLDLLSSTVSGVACPFDWKFCSLGCLSLNLVQWCCQSTLVLEVDFGPFPPGCVVMGFLLYSWWRELLVWPQIQITRRPWLFGKWLGRRRCLEALPCCLTWKMTACSNMRLRFINVWRVAVAC